MGTRYNTRLYKSGGKLDMKKTTLKISEIKPNPHNPRVIKDANFKKLVQSIKDFPEMAEVREVVVNADYMILGGNMRFKAMAEAGWKDIPVRIVDWSEDKQREFVIKDNISGGEWDWDAIANEWDIQAIEDWGLEMPVYGNPNDANEEWVGMPEFEGDDITSFKRLVVHFANQDDVDKFAKLVEQKVTETTRFIWYPEQEIDEVKNIRYGEQ